MSDPDDWIERERRELQRIVARLRDEHAAQMKPHLEELVRLEKMRRRGPPYFRDGDGVTCFVPVENTESNPAPGESRRNT